MKLRIDPTKEYGLVLEGGGAKGAYQIGAWKALAEAGIRIRAVAGTSVGALNGAFICMGDVDRAVQVWENIRYSRIMDVDDAIFDKLMKGHFRTQQLPSVAKELIKDLSDGGIDVTPLKELIEEHVEEERIQQSDCDLYIQTFSVTDRKELDIDIKKVDPAIIKDMLLAAAYLPPFKKNTIKGKKYIDGGMFNNVPVDALIDRGYKNIIVIRIFGIGINKRVKIPESVTVNEVAPRSDLGKLMEFDCKKSKKNIKLGYFDTLRLLYGLEGDRYYLDFDVVEDVCFKKVTEGVYRFLQSQDHESSYRLMMEEYVPELVTQLKLSKDWNYITLYIALVEITAKYFKIPRLRIYTEKEILDEILRREEDLASNDTSGLPHFVKIIMNIIHGM